MKTNPPYPETADIATSSDNYATRFAGTSGKWMLDTQERITKALLKGKPIQTILDVGGGHGQLAIPLAEAGYQMTVLGSDASCEHRIRSITANGICKFQVGNVVELPYPDRSFDAVISFRLVMHCERWPQLIRELCRVARHGVIIDYPTSQSFNVLKELVPALFHAKKKMETNTRDWTSFRHRQIHDEFARNGWTIGAARGQFFFPMGFHRTFKCRPVSAAIEGLTRAIGLNDTWGSPVIVCAEPRASA